jgi:hypothetical protein
MALTIKSVLSVYAPMVFKFFASSMYRNVLLKFLITSLNILTNSRYFTGSRIRISPHPHRDWQQLKWNWEPNSAIEVADNQSSTSNEK